MFGYAFLISAAFPAVLSIQCWDNGMGEPVLVEHPRTSFCLYIPSVSGHSDRQSAISDEEDSGLRGIRATFAEGDGTVYAVQSVCMQERYDFRTIFPNTRHQMKPEFMLRCFCRQDGCNKRTSFEQFLGIRQP